MHTVALLPQEGLCSAAGAPLQALGCAALGRARTRKELVGWGSGRPSQPQNPPLCLERAQHRFFKRQSGDFTLELYNLPPAIFSHGGWSSETMTNPKVPVIRPGRQPDIHAVTLTQTHRGGNGQREAAGTRSHRYTPAGRLTAQTVKTHSTDSAEQIHRHARVETGSIQTRLTTGTLRGQANPATQGPTLAAGHRGLYAPIPKF